MPAAVVLLRDRRSIAEVSGRFASVFGRPVVDLLGSDLLRFVSPGDASLVGSVIHEARAMAVGSVPSSVVARFEQPDGSRRLVELSAAHRADGSTRGATVVLLRPQTIRNGLNAALAPHVGWQDAGEQTSEMELADTALDSIVGVLGCEPVSHDCYFLKVDEGTNVPVRSPETADFADVPIAGPWDDILQRRSGWIDLDAGSLPPDLRLFAERRRYTAVRCVPVRASHSDRLVACLVAWDRKGRPLADSVETTFRYAAEITSLAIGQARVTALAVPVLIDPWPSDMDLVTGLPLEETLVRSLDQMITSGERPGLIFVRLTALDALRRTRGDFTTDQIVRVSARRVHSLIRMTDEVYRSGADGIAIVCSGSLDTDRLDEISTRLKERLRVPFRVDSEEPVSVQATIAAIQSPEDPVGGAELLTEVQLLMA
jgi:GGDEF domain-containing protein